MSLPQTPIPVVFKNNRNMNKYHAKDVDIIKASTQMGQLPTNTVVVYKNKYCLTYRYVGKHQYSYASLHTWEVDLATKFAPDNTMLDNQEQTELSGRTETYKELRDFIETVDRIKPFVSQLYNN